MCIRDRFCVGADFTKLDLSNLLDDWAALRTSFEGDLLAILLWPASFVLPNALRAANDVKFTMVTSILSMAIWRLGFSYLLCVRMGWGAVGVWIAMVIDWVCRSICFVGRFVSGVWKKKAVKMPN